MKQYGVIRIKVEERLQELNMSKDELSCKAQIPAVQINRYCTGQVAQISADVLARLCRALDCSICDLLEFVPPPRQKSKPKNKAPPVSFQEIQRAVLKNLCLFTCIFREI